MTLARTSIAALATAAALGLALASPASAAHCVDSEGTTPGYSYFGQEVAAGEREAQPTKGTSTCSDTDPDPQERAPGQNR